CQEVLDRRAEVGIEDEMRTPGRARQVAAAELVLALGAGLDAGEAARDREVDRLVVAGFEMQKGIIAAAPPVAAVERLRADQVERAADPLALARRHHQRYAIAHRRTQHVEEAAREIGIAPFALRRRDIEIEERIPVPAREAG